ncbi:uracil-DNA glycosylase family protein [Noviherbaspirillum galbum]|uniref:Uracil-DNA glycosylase family protein n=1 Tax=Noviherbaspirillum galbum TaxID=2709383 RepID=A0A6B3SQP0_9BURK|nr:uracil-DNA glycosylase family protein [Noviherbaspirillum galbum]NEX63240.1 uracil-DNA glycosylase family protein [Noviherbaspirillum galbum]
MKLLLKEIRACQACAAHLPHGVRPVVQAGRTARLLIVGQAPGRIVHETGIPWNDASGERLRQWLQMTPEVFYDARQVAIVPTGFCFPGTGRSGDLPPRPECAPLWHRRLLDAMPGVRLTLLIGAHAQKYYLRENGKASLTDNVRHFEDVLPRYFPLPHPSPRNRLWLARNPWFEQDVLPALRREVGRALASGDA